MGCARARRARKSSCGVAGGGAKGRNGGGVDADEGGDGEGALVSTSSASNTMLRSTRGSWWPPLRRW
eukprot:COSAG01_NODE_2592_length_7414_cov_6.421787_9_plen_67_part_00